MHSTSGLKKATQKKSATKSPQKQQKRTIISYRYNKQASQRRSAKNAMKNTEGKPAVVFKPFEQNLTGLTTQTLPDGNTVQIFRSKNETTRRFGKSINNKHAKTRVNFDTIESTIHNIATTVAQVKPIVIGETTIKDINNQYISNTHNFTKEDFIKNYQTNHIIRLSPPPFMRPGLFSRKQWAVSSNQRRRWQMLIQKRAAEIKLQKSQFQSRLDTLASYTPFDSTVQSTQQAPIDLTTDLGLKFRIIDAVIKHTKVQVPATALVTINNVSDLVNFIVEKKKELDAKAGIRKAQDRLPPNVTYVYKDKIDRSKKPQWKKWQALKQQKVATADV